jgi:hypothetical protein
MLRRTKHSKIEVVVPKEEEEEEGLRFCKGSIQYSSISEGPRTAFKSGFAHVCNEAQKDKASESIRVMCKIRYSVNRVVVLDIKEYIVVNSGDHPYSCDMCNKAFINKRGLVEH